MHGSSLQLDFEESKLECIGIDDIVVYPRSAAVGHTRGQLRIASTVRFDQPQYAAGQGNDHIVKRMDVLTGLSARGEPPLGDNYTRVVELYN